MAVYVIAEAGVNHNGSVDRALAMVDAAASAGVDAVKFQTFRAGSLASAAAPKAPYQAVQAGTSERQADMLAALELSSEVHFRLRDRCRAHGIEFLSTPFDLESLEFLVKSVGVARIKLGSSEVTHGPMLVAAGRTGLPVILSTGMSTLEEIRVALGALAFGYLDRRGRPTNDDFMATADSDEGRRMLAKNITLMHCTTAYPTPCRDVNLRAIGTLAQVYRLPVGYSDHTTGIKTAVAAVAAGAIAIEKHFTPDRTLPGPDHKASLEPSELTQLVKEIREVEITLGDGIKRPMPSERENLLPVRRSLVAARPIRQGERFDHSNLTAKRPGGGISPMEFWSWIGRTATRDYAADEFIDR